MKRVSVLVYRQEGTGLGATALVAADETQVVDSPASLLEAVTRAVTKWIVNTDEGRAAWKQSSEDFNIGDLDLYVGSTEETDNDKVLTRYLADEGVKHLVIEMLDTTDDWVFDTVLADSGDVDQALGEE